MADEEEFDALEIATLVKRLDFAKCRLSIAVPRSQDYTGVKSLQGKNIATSYPNIVKSFLARHNVEAGIHEISGSVEIAPGIGLADAICDIVSTGSTLLSNGLKEVEVVMQSEAVVIAGSDLTSGKQEILDKLAGFYEKEVNTVLGTLTTLLEPAIMILLGLAVAIMVAGILLPIYNLAGSQ